MSMGTYSLGDLILIRAVTMLHPGVGRGGEVVDLPVQRDNLLFPVIYSSSIKGVLKSALWIEDRNSAKAIFGPDPDEEDKYPSALMITDAFILAFPVRSLVGVYAFVTAPILLDRLMESINVVEASGIQNERLESLKTFIEKILEISKLNLDRDKALVSNQSILQIDSLGGNILINEELYLKPIVDENIKMLESMLKIDNGRLLIVSNDTARDAIDRSIIRVTRIRLGRESKTVVEGPWTEEYIPQWAIFQLLFLYSKPYKCNEALKDAKTVRERLVELIRSRKGYFIIGGDETIGKGIVKLEFI